MKRGDKVKLNKEYKGVPQGTKGRVVDVWNNTTVVAFSATPWLSEFDEDKVKEYLQIDENT